MVGLGRLTARLAVVQGTALAAIALAVVGRQLLVFIFVIHVSIAALPAIARPVVIAARPTAAVAVVVRDAHLQQLDGRPADAVLPQLLQLQTLAVLAAHVHQQRVVRDAEDARRLTGRHLLVPHVLERLGELSIGPGAWWASTWR